MTLMDSAQQVKIHWKFILMEGPTMNANLFSYSVMEELPVSEFQLDVSAPSGVNTISTHGILYAENRFKIGKFQS